MDTILIIMAVIIGGIIAFTFCGLGAYAFFNGAINNDWQAWHHFTSFVRSVIPNKDRQSSQDDFPEILNNKKPDNNRLSNQECNSEDNRHRNFGQRKP